MDRTCIQCEKPLIVMKYFRYSRVWAQISWNKKRDKLAHVISYSIAEAICSASLHDPNGVSFANYDRQHFFQKCFGFFRVPSLKRASVIDMQKAKHFRAWLFCGETGIRTLGTLVRYAYLANKSFRPLRHLSVQLLSEGKFKESKSIGVKKSHLF